MRYLTDRGTDLTCRRITKKMGYGFGVGDNRTNFMRYDVFDSVGGQYFQMYQLADVSWEAWTNYKQTLYDLCSGRPNIVIDAVNKVEFDLRRDIDGEGNKEYYK
jgi:hypothetical protein